MDLSRYDWLSRLSFKVECRLSHYADLIIVNSQAGRDYAVEKGYPANKIEVVYNGIDMIKFHPDITSRKDQRKRWKINENEYLIGLVGRLDPMKDHPTFLKAAQILLNLRSDVRFICIGDGSEAYKQDLLALCKELGIENKVIWEGARDDVCCVYNALDIVTSSSCYGEGFSNVIAEAMACGVPCIVTDVGDSKFIVGNNGVVVPPGCPDKLAEGWNLIMAKDDATNLSFDSDNIRKRIAENFSLENLAYKTSQALEQLIAHNGK